MIYNKKKINKSQKSSQNYKIYNNCKNSNNQIMTNNCKIAKMSFRTK